jgi:hypothetical protein
VVRVLLLRLRWGGGRRQLLRAPPAVLQASRGLLCLVAVSVRHLLLRATLSQAATAPALQVGCSLEQGEGEHQARGIRRFSQVAFKFFHVVITVRGLVTAHSVHPDFAPSKHPFWGPSLIACMHKYERVTTTS